MSHWPRRPPLYALTGLRFAAALLVVLHHYGDGLGLRARWALAVVERGYVGVSFFFVLSGFILAYVYADERAAWEPARRRAFWGARFARVYPVYALALGLTVPGFLAAVLRRPTPGRAAEGVASAVTTPLLLHAWTPWTSALWNYPSWSLSVEAFLYLVFAFGAPQLWRRSDGALAATAAVAYALALVAPLAAEAAGGRAGAPVLWSAAMSVPLVHLPQFGIGVCAGALVVRPGRPAPPWLWDAVAAAVAIALVATLGSAWPIPKVVLNAGLLAPLFAAFAYALARAPQGAWARTAGARPARALGEMSYAVYLLQLPVYQALGLVARGALARGTTLHLAVYLAVLIAVSATAHVVVERPARRALRRRLA